MSWWRGGLPLSGRGAVRTDVWRARSAAFLRAAGATREAAERRAGARDSAEGGQGTDTPDINWFKSESMWPQSVSSTYLLHLHQNWLNWLWLPEPSPSRGSGAGAAQAEGQRGTAIVYFIIMLSFYWPVAMINLKSELRWWCIPHVSVGLINSELSWSE